MERTAQELDGIRKAIEKLDNDIRALALEVINDAIASGQNIAEALMERVALPAELASTLSADIAQSVYNAWRVADIGETMETAAYTSFDREKFERMAGTAKAKYASGGTVEEVLNIVMSRVGYDNRTSYANTIFGNGKQDARKPKYARVPSGLETCAFCQMLASRGFQYTKGTSGEKVHNHANCQCVYVMSWDKSPKAQGYDPDAWYKIWNDSIDNDAKQRAERNGTSLDEERQKIMQQYREAANRAHKRARKK